MTETKKGLTNFREYDTYATYNSDSANRNDATISLMQQDNSIWHRGKRYSMNAECFVGDDYSTTAYWYKVGECVGAIGANLNLIASATTTYKANGAGVFALNVYFVSTTEVQVNRFSWLSQIGTLPRLKLVIDGLAVSLYAKIPSGQQYQRIHFKIIDMVAQNENSDKSVYFTLIEENEKQIDEPEGFNISATPNLVSVSNGNLALRWRRIARFKTTNTNKSAEALLYISDSQNMSDAGIYQIQCSSLDDIATNIQGSVRLLSGANKYQFKIMRKFPITSGEDYSVYDSFAYVDIYIQAASLTYPLIKTLTQSTYDNNDGDYFEVADGGSWITDTMFSEYADVYGTEYTDTPSVRSFNKTYNVAATAFRGTGYSALVLDNYNMFTDAIIDGDVLVVWKKGTFESFYPIYLATKQADLSILSNCIPLYALSYNSGIKAQWSGSDAAEGIYTFVYRNDCNGFMLVSKNVSAT